jgi:CheY-like chemotaxis protein
MTDEVNTNAAIRVLIADDERDIRLLVRFPLERRGITVLEATNGDDALRIARERQPELVLLDVMMPRIGGHEVCQLLRAIPELAGIPVVFLSARGQSGDIDAGLGAGADAYLVKPFRTTDLLEVVARFTGAELRLDRG